MYYNNYMYIYIFITIIIVVFFFSYGLLCQSDTASYRIMLNYISVYIIYSLHGPVFEELRISSLRSHWNNWQTWTAWTLSPGTSTTALLENDRNTLNTTIIRPSPSLSSTSGCLEALKRAWVAHAQFTTSWAGAQMNWFWNGLAMPKWNRSIQIFFESIETVDLWEAANLLVSLDAHAKLNCGCLVQKNKRHLVTILSGHPKPYWFRGIFITSRCLGLRTRKVRASTKPSALRRLWKTFAGAVPRSESLSINGGISWWNGGVDFFWILKHVRCNPDICPP